MENAAATKANISLSSGNSKIKDFTVGEFNYCNSYGNATLTNINTSETVLPGDVTEKNLELSMSSGDCKIENLVCDSLTIKNSYGGITCKEVTSKEFEASLSSGNLTVSKSDLSDVDIDNSYGDITLSLLGNSSDYMLDLSTSYGKIEVDGKKYDGNLVRENGGSKFIEADLSSGNVDIRFE
jgi:DUF4097 and DUF4098 domain-containing protein YvlB